MKDYSKFGAIDFAQDEYFIKWVKYGEEQPEVNEYWSQWVVDNSSKILEIEEAKRMIQAVIRDSEDAIDVEAKQLEVFNRLAVSIREHDDSLRERKTLKLNVIFKLAAVVVLLISVGVVLWRISSPLIGDETLALAESSEIIEVTNSDEEAPKAITLPDGSTVYLHAKSTLYYPSSFDDKTREVQLKGEAFFYVTKDPNKPFVVFADKLVTKVLGTSFLIRAFGGEDKLTVQVKTGKVSVGKIESLKANKAEETLLLTPNQQAIFKRNESALVKSLVDNPVLLESASAVNFQFVDTPLREVFSELEEAYGVEIVYDDEILGSCALNASLNNMSLYDKMHLICIGVNASYHVVDSHIVVTGQGCN